MGILDHLICLLRNVYAGQEATVRTGHWKVVAEPQKTLGFLASGGEEFNPGPVMTFCVIKFYSSIKEIEKASDIDIRRAERIPAC